MFTGEDDNLVVGLCLWCNEEFRSFEEAESHLYDGSGACPMFYEMSREPSTPPVLQVLLENAGLLKRFAKNDLISWERS